MGSLLGIMLWGMSALVHEVRLSRREAERQRENDRRGHQSYQRARDLDWYTLGYRHPSQSLYTIRTRYDIYAQHITDEYRDAFKAGQIDALADIELKEIEC